jgi:Protein of unknown function (DUF1569)
MNTIFETKTRNELIGRINTLNEGSPAQWGKMSINQMVRHCTLWEEMALGKTKLNRALLGRLFGKMALKGFLKDDSPMRRNVPSSPELKVTENIKDNFAAEKKLWIGLIDEYAHFSNFDFVHPFFGKMTKEQVGCLAYKHTDHHLRQFNS